MGESQIQLEVEGRRFTALSQGDGVPVLCLHGFPDHFRSYRHQLPALASAGYRAVAPQLRGYEPSSQLRRHVPDYHPLQLARDAVAWADELGDGAPIHLVGHDWGAVVAHAACALAPERFRSAATLAVPPAHALQRGLRQVPSQLRNSWYMFFFQLRVVADRVVRARDFAFIERLWRSWSPGFAWDAAEMEALKETFRQPGVVYSALAYYRAMLNPFLADTRRMNELGEKPVPVPHLAITGATDGCIDTRLYDFIDPAFYPNGCRVERVEGAGHFVHQEKPAETNGLLLEWLAAHADSWKR